MGSTGLSPAIQQFFCTFVELLGVRGVCFSRALSGSVSASGLSDERLVSLFQDGDRQAFEMLVQRYQNLAFTVCRRYLGNDQLAEETAQDVFVSLYRNLGKFRGDASFKSWFYRVVVNHCRNRHKALSRRKHGLHDSIDAQSGDEDRGRPRDLVDGKPDPEEALDARMARQLVERALETLGEEGRMILLLREGQGLAYEEIADMLGLRVGTVKSRIHRARAQLKRAVERLSQGSRPE